MRISYAVWFDDLGMRIAAGDTAKGGTIAVSYTHLDVYKRQLLALLDNIQAGNVTFLTAVNNASEEAETEEAIEKDA